MDKQSEALVVEIASILDHPSLYMGGPSRQSMKKARAILPIIEAREAALRAENATLAAGSCDVPGGKVGDEHGHFYCTLERELASAKEQAERLAEENARLRKLVDPEWFYLAGDMSSDRCRFSVAEVIDEDWLWDNRAEGTAVVQIETATRCPDIWALVHFFTNEEKDARESDDEYEIIEFASEAEARAALAAWEKSRG